MHVLMITPDCQMIDRRILQEATVLTDAGHRVTLLAGFECEREESYVESGIPVHRFSYDWDDERLKGLRHRLRRAPRLYGLLARIYTAWLRRSGALTAFERFVLERARAFRADVVHVHDLPLLRVGATLAREWGAPLVYDAHELFHAQRFLAPALRRHYEEMERELVRKASAVITVNEFLARRMSVLHAIPMPWVVYNSTVPRGLVAPSGELRKRIPSEGPLLLYQGWISEERNLETLVRAMADAPGALAIIGYGGFEAELRRIAMETGVASRVHFLGRVPSQEILDLTADADLGVIPYLPIDDNHRLCSPNKFFEYVLSGVPVLAHDLPFFRAMSREHGVVQCGDLSTPRSMAAAIRDVTENGRLEGMRRRCLEAVPRLEWSVEARKLALIYAGLESV